MLENVTHKIMYDPCYFIGTKRIFPTDTNFETVSDAIQYLQDNYPDLAKIAKNGKWMGVLTNNVDIEDGDITGGEFLGYAVKPAGKFWVKNNGTLYFKKGLDI